jgi:sporulation protein YlmC with PRC-barrel domain
MASKPPVPEHPMISAHRVEGAAVFNPAGEQIGRIEDIMIEKLSGLIASATLCYGGPFNAAGGRFPVPWNCLSYDVARHGYVVDEARVKASRQVDLDLFGGDLPWHGVDHHWAAPPYWYGAAPRPPEPSR